MRTTHTFAILEIPDSAYAAVRKALEDAGPEYLQDATREHDEGEVIHIPQIALRAVPELAAERSASSVIDTPPQTAYVCGFMFSADLSRVLLIRKLKPRWQRGKLNGLGGKIEAGETPSVAMRREFLEECGHDTATWHPFMVMKGAAGGSAESFMVTFFVALAPEVEFLEMRSMEEEQVERVQVASIHPMRADMVENLPWLIPLAIDFLVDGRPSFVTAAY